MTTTGMLIHATPTFPSSLITPEMLQFCHGILLVSIPGINVSNPLAILVSGVGIPRKAAYKTCSVCAGGRSGTNDIVDWLMSSSSHLYAR